ncbi:hypothetical protein Agub_g9513, partial [Astrephomene gubernaculifera]
MGGRRSTESQVAPAAPAKRKVLCPETTTGEASGTPPTHRNILNSPRPSCDAANDTAVSSTTSPAAPSLRSHAPPPPPASQSPSSFWSRLLGSTCLGVTCEAGAGCKPDAVLIMYNKRNGPNDEEPMRVSQIQYFLYTRRYGANKISDFVLALPGSLIDYKKQLAQCAFSYNLKHVYILAHADQQGRVVLDWERVSPEELLEATTGTTQQRKPYNHLNRQTQQQPYGGGRSTTRAIGLHCFAHRGSYLEAPARLHERVTHGSFAAAEGGFAEQLEGPQQFGSGFGSSSGLAACVSPSSPASPAAAAAAAGFSSGFGSFGSSDRAAASPLGSTCPPSASTSSFLYPSFPRANLGPVRTPPTVPTSGPGSGPC